jgi:hypothetical protein
MFDNLNPCQIGLLKLLLLLLIPEMSSFEIKSRPYTPLAPLPARGKGVALEKRKNIFLTIIFDSC